ncbi:MAG: PDZ domain-containing protein [Acidimicrobiia bacterium]
MSILVIAAAIAGSAIHVSKRTIRPGDVGAMSTLVHVQGASPSKGDFYLLTVAVGNHDLNLFEEFWAKRQSDTEIVNTKDLLGGLSDTEDRCLSQYEMVDAEAAAQLAAADVLGIDVKHVKRTVVVLQLVPKMPAAAVLEVCDVITAIDGQEVSAPADVTKYVRAHEPGDTAEITVRRSGAERTFDVKVGQFENKDGTKRPGIGVSPIGIVRPDSLPLGVEINPDQVTGPSGGLGFTLEIIDQLTEGDLTGGKHIAVTGTISADGNVGAIGGARLKAIAARRAGTDYMITPTEDASDARKGAGNMKVYAVSTLDQALALLRKHGGAPIPKAVPKNIPEPTPAAP